MTTLTLESLRAKWIGRSVWATTQDELTPASMWTPRKVEEIWENRREEKFVAWTGEHVVCGSLEALDRRLHSLAK